MHSLLLTVTLAIACAVTPIQAGYHDRMVVHRRQVDMEEYYLDTEAPLNATMMTLVGQDMQDENAQGHLWKRAMGPAWTGASTLKTSKLRSQVSAMQLTVTGLDSVLYVSLHVSHCTDIDVFG